MADRRREAPLAMDGGAFRDAGHRLVDQIAELLDSLPARSVTTQQSPSSIREALNLNGPLPEEGTDPATLLADLPRQLFDHSLFNAHPRFFGYITAPAAPIGILADFLASALNANVGAWRLGPAATEIETQTVRWIAELIGYPSNCGGLLVSGGNMANIVCLLAARAARAGWDVRTNGVSPVGGRKLMVYGSAETHTWIQKAADVAGIGTNAIRWIETGPDLRMDVSALTRAIDDDLASGCVPFCVDRHWRLRQHRCSRSVAGDIARCAARRTSGSTWTARTAGLRRRFPKLPMRCGRSRTPTRSRSIRTNGSTPRSRQAARWFGTSRRCATAFSYHPPYYHFAEQATNYVDLGLQNSRGFRALKVWLALRHAGAAGYRRMISDDILLSRAMADARACACRRCSS